MLVLTKPARGPALYWHQDWMMWNDPLSCTPWPQTIFVSYYLDGTSVENGCLKIIPGTHRKRIPLHDTLVTAHEQGARFIEEDHPVMFSDHPDQVNVEVGPRDLVLADARVLHAAYKNRTDEPRDLLLLWHRRPMTRCRPTGRAKCRPSSPTATPTPSTNPPASPANSSPRRASRRSGPAADSGERLVARKGRLGTDHRRAARAARTRRV